MMAPPREFDADLLKRPLYVYDLPQPLLDTLRSKAEPSTQPDEPEIPSSTSVPTPPSTPPTSARDAPGPAASSASCALCSTTFPTAVEQRAHAKTDWHAYNLKQRMRAAPALDAAQFEALVGELDESISGSDGSSTDDTGDDAATGGSGDGSRLASLLKRQARMHGSAPAGLDDADADDEAFFGAKKRKRGSGRPPLMWFESELLPENTSLGVYRALATPAEQDAAGRDPVGLLRAKQLRPAGPQRAPRDDGNGVPLPAPKARGPCVFICMIGGGHFAAMIVSLAPEVTKNHAGAQERRVNTIAQKTFHRYTTRRKQGGAQSSNDAAKGNANSAGAGIRRANEAALTLEVRNLLWEWRGLIEACELLFVRASGTMNRRLLFEKHERQVLKTDDERVRSIPFSTRRATQQECMRVFVELTRVKVSQVDEAALAAAQAERDREEQRTRDRAAAAASAPKAQEAPALSPEEEEALVHTGQLQALIRRNKVPGLLSYLSKNGISSNFRFQPESSQANHHASTPLHLAASLNSPIMVNALLTKAEADPSLPNGEGKPAFDIAGDRATRDSFRVARSELGESRRDWSKSHIPSALTKTEAEQRDKEEKALDAKGEAERRKTELDRLEQERADVKDAKAPAGKRLMDFKKTAEDKREAEARSMTPELRMKIERERRARAAEERMRRLAGNQS